MKFAKFFLLYLLPPLVAALTAHYTIQLEPYFRQIMGWAQVSDTEILTLGFPLDVMFACVPFLILHLFFLGTRRFSFLKNLYAQHPWALNLAALAVFICILALSLYAPEVSDTFGDALMMASYVFGVPMLVAEMLSLLLWPNTPVRAP